MGKLVFGMMQSLDGYVDGVADGWNSLRLAWHFPVISRITSAP